MSRAMETLQCQPAEAAAVWPWLIKDCVALQVIFEGIMWGLGCVKAHSVWGTSTWYSSPTDTASYGMVMGQDAWP